ncbi:STAS domain-containing protein [Kitasatospora aureofaciens]|uniref:STAS domain-containing protein n=1 Tax=Kitasatospora aureofaciens TaxID=1894 RepID=UPI0033ECCFDA
MTDLPPADFTLAVDSTPRTLTVRVAGELDYDTSGELLDTVTAHLGHHRAGPREVRLDCGGITWIDSSGLSALLMIRRRTDDAGAVLHLDDRPPALERLLDLTDVLPYFAARRANGGTDEPPGEHG